MDVEDIKEQMAFDLSQDEEWRTKQVKKAELEASRNASPKQKASALKTAFRGLRNGNHK